MTTYRPAALLDQLDQLADLAAAGNLSGADVGYRLDRLLEQVRAGRVPVGAAQTRAFDLHVALADTDLSSDRAELASALSVACRDLLPDHLSSDVIDVFVDGDAFTVWGENANRGGIHDDDGRERHGVIRLVKPDGFDAERCRARAAAIVALLLADPEPVITLTASCAQGAVHVPFAVTDHADWSLDPDDRPHGLAYAGCG